MTNSKKILELLADGDWHCTSEMYSMYISDPRTIICQLRHKGYEFESRPCKKHEHTHSKEWRLLTEPVQINFNFNPI